MTDIDLSPRPASDSAPRRSKRRKWAPLAVLALVVVAGGVMVTQFLRSAVDYYCNVDEVGVKNGCEADRSIRMQGEVVEDSVVHNGDGSTDFTMAFNGVSIPVDYKGVPTGVFQECINVVVSGRYVDGVFDGRQIAVKHSNEYEAKHSDRVSEGEDPACLQRA